RTPRSLISFQPKAFVLLAVRAFLHLLWGRSGELEDRSPSPNSSRRRPKSRVQWTIFGLAQELGVHRNWLYTRIHKGTLPATRHSVTGHYLIADEPEILAMLRAERGSMLLSLGGHSYEIVKTHLQHLLTAGAINLVRFDAWCTGVP